MMNPMCPRCGSYDLDNSGAQNKKGQWTAICCACALEFVPALQGPFRRPGRTWVWWLEHAALVTMILLTIIAVVQWLK